MTLSNDGEGLKSLLKMTIHRKRDGLMHTLCKKMQAHLCLEYYQLNSGMRALCLSREKINSHWLKGCVIVFKPMRVAPLLG